MYVLICFHCELFYSKLHVNVKNCHVIKFKEPEYLYKHDIHFFSKGLLVLFVSGTKIKMLFFYLPGKL